MKHGPLTGVRVVEYGVFHAGPGAGAILGDLGADVVKIEAKNGDPERFWTVVGGLSIEDPATGESIMYEVSNRNKRGICLDIKTPRGREVLEKLVAGADVFLTNLRKSTKTKLNIDYESIRALNPRIIHANVSGYGPDGPAADMGAFDPMGQARSGMMFLSDPERPQLVHLAVLDQATAIAASHAVLAALFARERHGVGQEVHVSLFSTGIWLLYANYMCKSMLGTDPSISWVRFENSPLRNNFQCADGKWILGVHHPEEKYWERFCRVTGQEALLTDPRFADRPARRKNCRELVVIFDAVIASRTRDEWMKVFTECGLMFSPVQRIEDVFADPQALECGYVVEYDHPEKGPMKIPGYPHHFSAAAPATRSFAPALGQHSKEILAELGYSEEAVEGLVREGAVRMGAAPAEKD
ncbi:MAG: CoA transferase [Pseudomonadota bacterium]